VCSAKWEGKSHPKSHLKKFRGRVEEKEGPKSLIEGKKKGSGPAEKYKKRVFEKSRFSRRKRSKQTSGREGNKKASPGKKEKRGRAPPFIPEIRGKSNVAVIKGKRSLGHVERGGGDGGKGVKGTTRVILRLEGGTGPFLKPERSAC